MVEGRSKPMHLPLGDAWIRRSLQAALEVDLELRGPSLWQRLLDAAIGEGRCKSQKKKQAWYMTTGSSCAIELYNMPGSWWVL